MKSCIAFIWDEKFSQIPRSRLLICKISVTEIIFVSYEHNFPRLAGKLSVYTFAKSTSQRETLPGKRENIYPYEQNKIIWPVEMFLGNRDNFCPYEQALNR